MIYKIKRKIKLLCRYLKSQYNVDIISLSNGIYPKNLEKRVTFDKVSLPVYKNYRYQLKPAWNYFGPISALSDLNKRSLLEPEDNRFLKDAIGHRTLTVSLDECRNVLKKYIDRHGELFISEIIPDLGKRLLKPKEKQLRQEVQSHINHHNKLLQGLIQQKLLEKDIKSLKILEIGYTSGGTSVIAFEELGLEAYGIDYFFDESVDNTPRHDYIRNLLNSKVQYHVGDITKKTVFEAESFDIVYSSSTIEHIKNLPAAFEEIKRILKPGGLSIHKYDPFFHPLGGHSLGTLDSPWGHVRLTRDAYFEYLKELRPFESDIAIQWIENALNPDYTMSKIQQALLNSGFAIKEWENQYISSNQKKYLNHEIIADAFRVIPNLTLQDLITRKVSFISQRQD